MGWRKRGPKPKRLLVQVMPTISYHYISSYWLYRIASYIFVVQFLTSTLYPKGIYSMDLRSAHKAAEKSPEHLHLSLTHPLDPQAGHAAQKFCSKESGVYHQLVHHKRKKRNLKGPSVDDWEGLEKDDSYEEEVIRQEEIETDRAALNSEYVRE